MRLAAPMVAVVAALCVILSYIAGVNPISFGRALFAKDPLEYQHICHEGNGPCVTLVKHQGISFNDIEYLYIFWEKKKYKMSELPDNYIKIPEEFFGKLEWIDDRKIEITADLREWHFAGDVPVGFELKIIDREH